MSKTRRVVRGQGPSQSSAGRFFASCPRGLEALLREDIAAAGGRDISIAPGGVAFRGSKECSYRLNLHSRIATRVLRAVGEAQCQHENDIYRLAYDIPWLQIFSVSRSIRVHTTAVRSHFKSVDFITLRVKDAVCDRFRADVGKRPDVNTAAPDIRIHLFINNDNAVLYVDISGNPLWLRGQKIAKVSAPLKENLAAGILRLSGWQAGTALLDPMCGSGTFLLEAAGMALGDAPGLARDMKDFGFTRLLDYEPALWKRLCIEAAENRVIAADLPLWGSDIDEDAVNRSRQNLAFAGLDDLVSLQCINILQLSRPAAEGIMVANLPYGVRLSTSTRAEEFWPQLGKALRQNFSGWKCYLLAGADSLPEGIGIKPFCKIPLYNGAIECRLLGFEIW